MEYSKFQGSIIYPTRSNLDLAFKLQLKMKNKGRLKPFSDLLITAICTNRNEELTTKDTNFNEIAEISKLKLRIE